LNYSGRRFGLIIYPQDKRLKKIENQISQHFNLMKIQITNQSMLTGRNPMNTLSEIKDKVLTPGIFTFTN